MIVWLASYPRSGNTFFRVLLKYYFGINTYSIYADKRLLERREILDIVGHTPRSMSLPEMMEADELFFVKTHDLPSDDLAAIYLVRDGRDALISYAHYILTYEQSDGVEITQDALNQTIHDLIVYNASFGGWGPNVLAWAQRSAPRSCYAL